MTIRYTVGAGTTVPADPTPDQPGCCRPVAWRSAPPSIVKVAAFDAAGNKQRGHRANSHHHRRAACWWHPDRRLLNAHGGHGGASAGGHHGVRGRSASLKSDAQETDGNTATRATSYLQFTVPALAAGESITAASLGLQVQQRQGERSGHLPDGDRVERVGR